MLDIVLYSALMAFYLLVVGSQMLAVLLENRQPVRTIAWLMVLSFMPVVGLVVYFFFGKHHKREYFLSRACTMQLAHRSVVRFHEEGFPEYPAEHEALIRLFRRQNAAFPCEGNKINYYTGGDAMLDDLLNDVAAARHHIHIETYIMEDDKVANQLIAALAKKVKEGVIVRIIYDSVGCWNVKQRFFNHIRQLGIQTAEFMPVRFPKLTSKVDYRNHRKIVVIDGVVGYVGGMNIADRYFSDTERDGRMWRDTQLRMSGSGVVGMQRAFLADWYVATTELITEDVYYPRSAERMEQREQDAVPATTEHALVQVVTSFPGVTGSDIMQGLVFAVMRARKYCYLQTPYFMPTGRMLYALQTAASAGVDVKLMIPEHADKRFLMWASRSYLSDAMKAGVRVYLYKGRFLHSKLMVCDDSLMSCGSTNIDFRSFERNFEVNAFVYDKKMALAMKSVFLDDQRHCSLLNLTAWEKRSIGRRMGESLARLFTPLL